MSRPTSSRLTSAHAIALLALFISLGGTSYAVTKLPKNSVGSAQVKDGSLTAKDLAKGTVKTGPAGPAGSRGPRGAEGPAGAAAPGRPPVVSRLPGSAGDGDEILLDVDPGGELGGPYLWHLRYDASLPAAKWRVIKGEMLWRGSSSGFDAASTTWSNGGAPRITPPVAGIYRWEARVSGQSGGAVGGEFMGLISAPATPSTGFGYAFVSADGGYDRSWNLLGPANESQPTPAERTVSYAVSKPGMEFGPVAIFLMATPIRLGA